MKRHEILFAVLKLPIEFALAFMSFFLAAYIRSFPWFERVFGLPPQSIASEQLIWFALFGSVVSVLVLSSSGLYEVRTTTSRASETLAVISGLFYSFLFCIAGIYLGNGYIYTTEIPRLILVMAFAFIFIALFVERRLADAIQWALLSGGSLERRRLLILLDRDEPNILSAIGASRTYTLAGYASRTPKNVEGMKAITGLDTLIETIRTNAIDDLLLVHTDYDQAELQTIFEMARIYGIGYRYVTNRFEAEKSNTELSFIDSIPVVEIRSIGIRPWSRVIKRIFDIGASAVGLVVLSPLLLVVAIIIKVWEPSAPVIYRNRRVGKNGSEFELFKFRYIRWEYCVKDAYGVKHEDDPAIAYERALIAKQSTRAGAIYKIQNDPRKTRIGTFIERYSIDELPQLWNVLKGEMSLIGPRPHQPREVERYDEPSRRVLTFKPGITWMAQIHGRDGNPLEREIALDIYYIENWSMYLDMKILFQTIGVVFRRKGV